MAAQLLYKQRVHVQYYHFNFYTYVSKAHIIDNIKQQ